MQMQTQNPSPNKPILWYKLQLVKHSDQNILLKQATGSVDLSAIASSLANNTQIILPLPDAIRFVRQELRRSHAHPKLALSYLSPYTDSGSILCNSDVKTETILNQESNKIQETNHIDVGKTSKENPLTLTIKHKRLYLLVLAN